MKQHKIVPCLWFQTEGGKISAVTNYYQNIFGENFKQGESFLSEKRLTGILKCVKGKFLKGNTV